MSLSTLNIHICKGERVRVKTYGTLQKPDGIWLEWGEHYGNSIFLYWEDAEKWASEIKTFCELEKAKCQAKSTTA